MTPEKLEKEPRVIELVPDLEQGGWCVLHPDLPGCISQGETIEVALANLADAREGWEEAYLECHKTLPKPDDMGPSYRCHEALKEIRRCWAARDEVIRRAESKKEFLASRISVDWLAFRVGELEEIIEPLRDGSKEHKTDAQHTDQTNRSESCPRETTSENEERTSS